MRGNSLSACVDTKERLGEWWYKISTHNLYKMLEDLAHKNVLHYWTRKNTSHAKRGWVAANRPTKKASRSLGTEVLHGTGMHNPPSLTALRSLRTKVLTRKLKRLVPLPLLEPPDKWEPEFPPAPVDPVDVHSFTLFSPPDPVTFYKDQFDFLKQGLDSLPNELLQYIYSFVPVEHCPAHNRLAEAMLSRWEKKKKILPDQSKPKPAVTKPEMDVDLDVDVADQSTFVRHSRWVHESRSRVERLDKTSDGYDSEVDKELAIQRRFLGSAFREFARSIGVPVERTFSFNKKDSDAAFRECFGAYGEPGSGKFLLPGMKEELLLERSLDDARIFSLYLGRKAFVCHDPRDQALAVEQFLEDACTPPPPLSPELTHKKARMLRFIKKLTKAVVGRRRIPPKRPMPNSGKACLEIPRSKGGKREALYCSSSLDETHRFHVRATATLTSGKLRPITIASVFQEVFSWLNQFLFSKLRKLKCMIAGRELVDWVNEVFFCHCTPDSESDFVSGDLKKATTLFSSDFCDAVIDTLAPLIGLSDEDVVEIKSGVTHAEFGHVDEFLGWVVDGVQKRGQNLGADISFPILCMITITIAIETLGETERFLKMNERQFRKAIMNEDRFGVNGDDFITRGRQIAGCWQSAVAATSGVAEMTKSPVNNVYWTANSQLFKLDKPVPFVSPALCFNLSERLKNPQNQWIDQLRSPILNIGRIGLGHMLLGDVPRAFGGLGNPIAGDVQWAKRFLFAKRSRGVDITSWLEEERPIGLIYRGRGKTVMALDTPENLPGVSVTGLVRTDWLKEYGARVYALKDILNWSESHAKYPSYHTVIKKVDREIKQCVPQGRRVKNGRWMTFTDPPNVLQLIEQAEAYNWAEDHGLTFVREKTFYEPVEVRERLPNGDWAKHIM